MKTKEILIIVGIAVIVAVAVYFLAGQVTGNAIFDVNQKISASVGKTTFFSLEGDRYSLKVLNVTEKEVAFSVTNRDTGKSVDYTSQFSEGVPLWNRYDIYASGVKGKTVTFVITEKSISAGNAYTKEEVDAKWNELRQEIAGTDIEVLEMLNQRCEVVDGSESGITNPEEYSCENICSKKRADLVCTFGIGTYKVSNSTIGDQKVVIRSCQDRTSPYNTYLSCMCCHSP